MSQEEIVHINWVIVILKYYFIGCWAHRTRVQNEGMPRDAYEMAYWCTFMRTRVAPQPWSTLYWSWYLLCFKLVTNSIVVFLISKPRYTSVVKKVGYPRVSEESLLVIYTNSAIHWHMFYYDWLRLTQINLT
jgi:hypothetical protein